MAKGQAGLFSRITGWLRKRLRHEHPPRPGIRGDRSFVPKPGTVDRHGFLTDGKYRVSNAGSARHTASTAPAGKSYFYPHVDQDQTTLHAAQYADHANLWGPDGKAKVPFDQNIGVHAKTGQPTNVVNVYRRRSGTVHGSPGSPL
jgi:nucleoid-associated protein YgaU